MKIQIRRGVFETNSSSVHSISIIKDNFNGSLPSQFTINCDGEFGWEVKTYDDAESKAAYLYQAILYYPYDLICKRDDIDKAQEILQGLIDKFIKNIESYGIEVDCKYRFTKIESIECCSGETYNYVIFADENGNSNENFGYLDHGGEAKDLVDYVLSSPENTVKFIFDNRCFIDTGNDNMGIYGDCENREYGESIIFEKGN